MKTFRFLDFPVYKDAKQFYKLIIDITRNFPKEHYDLTKQLIRAVLSISLNIAEGSAKKSEKDFNRYIENSLGSVNESMAAINIALDNQLINNEQFKQLEELVIRIAKQLGGLSKKLRS